MNNPFEEILNELAEIRAAIAKIKVSEAPVIIQDKLTAPQAVEYLRDEGYPIELSQFYKLTANCTIPSQRIGKRLILSRRELDLWLESRKYRRVSAGNKAAKSLADSATKRIERAKA